MDDDNRVDRNWLCLRVMLGWMMMLALCHSIPSYGNTLSKQDVSALSDAAERFKSIASEVSGIENSLPTHGNDLDDILIASQCLQGIWQDVALLNIVIEQASVMTAASSVMKNRDDELVTLHMVRGVLRLLVNNLLPNSRQTMGARSERCHRYSIVVSEYQKVLSAIDAAYTLVNPIAGRLRGDR